jgi:hypothetical protein
MVDFYKTKVDVLNSEWSKGISNYPNVMVDMFVDFWPYARFGNRIENNKALNDWIKNNENKLKDLQIQATEALSVMKTNNLL